MIHEVEALFERQARAWPQLAKGIEGLATREDTAGTDRLVRHFRSSHSSSSRQYDGARGSRVGYETALLPMCGKSAAGGRGRAVWRGLHDLLQSVSNRRASPHYRSQGARLAAYCEPVRKYAGPCRSACRDISSSTTVPNAGRRHRTTCTFRRARAGCFRSSMTRPECQALPCRTIEEMCSYFVGANDLL